MYERLRVRIDWKTRTQKQTHKQIVIALKAEMTSFTIHDTEKSSHQCNQVPGVFATEVPAAAEDDESHEEDCIGDVVRPGVNSDKLLGVFAKGEDGHERECDQELHSQHQEDLMKKGGFGVFEHNEKSQMQKNIYIIIVSEMKACKTYLSDESLSDALILKTGVCEIIIIIIRWRPINMVTRASSRA